MDCSLSEAWKSILTLSPTRNRLSLEQTLMLALEEAFFTSPLMNNYDGKKEVLRERRERISKKKCRNL